MVEDLIKRLRLFHETRAPIPSVPSIATEAADLIEQQAARIAELEAAIRKQANAARSLADATIRDASIRQGLAEKALAESSPEVLASERQANALLTEENERLNARLTALESERDALLAAAGKEAVAHKFALIRDRNYDGEGLSLWTWNGENYSGADGDCLSPDPDGTLDGYTTEWLTDYQLEQRLNATAPTAALENGDGRDAWQPQWIVNDLGELGVKVGSRFFFLYKGDNIEYGADCDRDGVALHDDGTQMKYRIVGKREFGEVCWPLSWIRANRCEDRYTENLVFTPGLSFGKPEDGDWKPLPAALSQKAGEK
jgi:hypothetical protein